MIRRTYRALNDYGMERRHAVKRSTAPDFSRGPSGSMLFIWDIPVVLKKQEYPDFQFQAEINFLYVFIAVSAYIHNSLNPRSSI